MPKVRREPRVTVGYEFTGQPVVSEYRVEKDTSSAMCLDELGYCRKMYHLAETIYKYKNTIILVAVFGKTEYEVHGDELPTLCRNRLRL